MIDFVNAVSPSFVALIFVLCGCPTVWFIGIKIKQSSHEARLLKHTETMKQMEGNHAEALAKIKSNNPKMIEGISH